MRCDELLGWAERIGPRHHFVILDFLVTVSDGRSPVAGDDAAEAGWFPLPSVTQLALVDGLAALPPRPRRALTVAPVSAPSRSAPASR